MKFFGSLSFLLHILIGIVVFSYTIPKNSPINTQIELISPEKFQNILKEMKIVRSDDYIKGLTRSDKIKKDIFWSKTTNVTKKNTVAKEKGEFNNDKKTTTVHEKGAPTTTTKGKGVSATDDFIEGAEIGPMTILNTQEFKYFNFYDRLRSQIVEIWRPQIREAIFKVKSNPEKYGQLQIGTYTTKLLLIYNQFGNITNHSFQEKSGMDLFDVTGIKSFKDFGQLYGIPNELVVNGQFKLRWDFVIIVEPSGLVDFKSSYKK